jgi:hypothetical protein
MALLNSRIKLNPNFDSEGNLLDNMGQIRGLNDDTFIEMTDNTLQISDGVLVTRERVVFPDVNVKYREDRSSSTKFVNTA